MYYYYYFYLDVGRPAGRFRTVGRAVKKNKERRPWADTNHWFHCQWVNIFKIVINYYYIRKHIFFCLVCNLNMEEKISSMKHVWDYDEVSIFFQFIIIIKKIWWIIFYNSTFSTGLTFFFIYLNLLYYIS